ncbi:ABC transporter substrate binding protein [Roseibium sp.]|uniref:ABC transporter substrate binding protein n=1 Tax=Roseibium sp. TaxID=1936156 RepID=UPI003D109CF2
MLLRLALMFLLFSGCYTSDVAAEVKSILVITWRGITQAEQGFMHKLEELGIEADYEIFDAGRDQDRLAGFLRDNQEKLKSKDLIYTFGTTTTLTAQNIGTAGVPLVFNIVANPVEVGIARSLAAPSLGATGAKVSLAPEVAFEMLEHIYPFAKIGILFDPREPNSVSEVERLSAVAEANGKQAIRLRLSPDAKKREVQVASLKPQLLSADVIFVAATSSFVAHAGLIRDILPDDIVSIGSTTVFLKEGVTLVFGTEYWERGEAVANLAAKILVDHAIPNDLAIAEVTAANATLFVNRNNKAVSKLNLQNADNPIVYK